MGAGSRNRQGEHAVGFTFLTSNDWTSNVWMLKCSTSKLLDVKCYPTSNATQHQMLPNIQKFNIELEQRVLVYLVYSMFKFYFIKELEHRRGQIAEYSLGWPYLDHNNIFKAQFLRKSWSMINLQQTSNPQAPSFFFVNSFFIHYFRSNVWQLLRSETNSLCATGGGDVRM
jgi:hypothetical protein